jgi:transcriptional regulator with XRE-family HTH domain
MITNKEELEKQVRNAMKTSNLSVYKLAEKTEVSKTHIHGIIKETQKPSLEVLMRIAQIFDIKYTFSNVKELFTKNKEQ